MFHTPAIPNPSQAVSLGIMLLYVAVGALCAGLSLPLIRRRVKPNPMYGFRTTKTLSNERIWYESNAYSGRWLLRLGMVLIVASIALYLVLRANFVLYCVACGTVQLVGLALVVFLSYRHLRTL